MIKINKNHYSSDKTNNFQYHEKPQVKAHATNSQFNFVVSDFLKFNLLEIFKKFCKRSNLHLVLDNNCCVSQNVKNWK